ncbi:ABC transporter permease [Halanaerobiaceae bacterium Z-7014]|uniref:ABC transporter permease n=1 Tax=Halonatronomonas betaini TaxID=2778430 RepID=A0A931AQQ0_9FIRM|nr:FtsX-like permease family protein [Halonatronomonas betaini]MBF8436071.1 ABC transporter permease [Halonatronomonas betaini]
MYLLKIAFRNLFRRKKRTFIISGLLVIAVIIFLLLESFLFGMFDLAFENIIDVSTPHLEIAREELIAETEAGEDIPLEETFYPEEELISEVETLESLQAYTGLLDFSADFIAGRHEFPVLVRSIEPASFGQVFRNEDYLVAGDFIRDSEDDGVVIGDQLARFFDLEVGDFYTLRFQDDAGSLNTLQGEVRGIISTPDPEVNLRTVYIASAQSYLALGIEEDLINRLVIRLDNRHIAADRADELSLAVQNNDFTIQSYEDTNEMLVSAYAWNTIEIYFILGLFLLVGIIGIFTAIVLAAIERVEEIGMMKAMGLKQSEIIKILIYEAAGIGLIGSLIGSFIGLLLLIVFNIYGVSADLIGMADIGIFPIEGGRIHGAINLSSFLLIIFLVIFVSIIASIIPAYWASKKNPAEAIHHK